MTTVRIYLTKAAVQFEAGICVCVNYDPMPIKNQLLGILKIQGVSVDMFARCLLFHVVVYSERKAIIDLFDLDIQTYNIEK